MRDTVQVKSFMLYPKDKDEPPCLKTYYVLVINDSKVAYFSDTSAAEIVCYALKAWMNMGKTLEALQRGWEHWKDYYND
jgi:hypothetical protein